MCRNLTIMMTAIFLTLHALLGSSVHHGHASECSHEASETSVGTTCGHTHGPAGHRHEDDDPNEHRPADKHPPCPEESCSHDLEFSFTTGQKVDFTLIWSVVHWLSGDLSAPLPEALSKGPERVDRIGTSPPLERQSLRALTQVWRL